MFGLVRASSNPAAAQRASLATKGVIYVVLMVSSFYLLLLATQGTFSREARVKAQLVTVGDAMKPGAVVKFRGLTVGSVNKVDLNPPGSKTPITATLLIDRGHLENIPADVTARVLPLTFLANSHVQLVDPEKSAAASLTPGAEIAAATDNLTFLLQDAMDIVQSLIGSVSPAKIAAVISTIAETWEGRGDRLGEITAKQEEYLKRWEKELPRFRHDLKQLAGTLHEAAETAPDIIEGLENSLPIIRSFSSRLPLFEELLARSAPAADELDRWFKANGDKFINFANGTEPFWDSLGRNRRFFSDSLIKVRHILNFTIQLVQQSGPNGPALGLEFVGGLGFSFDGYTADDCIIWPGVGGFPEMKASNCPDKFGSKPGAGFPAAPTAYGGNVGPVGSAYEQQAVRAAFGVGDEDAYGVYLAPFLRGRTVVPA